jgi:hypothetical protein
MRPLRRGRDATDEPSAWDEAAPDAWLIEHRDPSGRVAVSVGRTGSNYLVRSHGVADFRIRGDGRVEGCSPVAGIDDGLVEQAFAQQVRPGTHQLRGKPALHASAVVGPRGALCLCGDSGSGKSTLAALLSQRWPVLADDFVPLRRTRRSVVALGTARALRLRTASADALGAPDDGLGGKRILEGAKRACRAPAAAIVQLAGEANDVEIQVLSRRDALLAVARHVHRLDPHDETLLAAELDFLSSIVECLPVVRMRYPRRFDVGPAIAERLNDLGQASSAR